MSLIPPECLCVGKKSPMDKPGRFYFNLVDAGTNLRLGVRARVQYYLFLDQLDVLTVIGGLQKGYTNTPLCFGM